MIPTLEKFRQKYPQYNDVPDAELASRIRNKYYADIPEEEFFKKFGVTNESKQADSENPLLAGIRNVAYGGLVGLGKGGQKIASALTGGYAPTVNMEETFAPVKSPNEGVISDIERGIGQYIPYGVAGGPSLLGQTLAGGAFGAAEAQPGNETMGALEGGAINAITHGALSGINALRPTQIFRGALSPEELQQNLEATKGTTTNLGEVINSPTLKRLYENVMPNVPFGGTYNVMQKTAKQVTDKGKDLLEKIGEGIENKESPTLLQDALKKASQQARKEKIENYNKVNEMADKSGLKVGRNNFAQAAQHALEDIGSSPELSREFPSDLLSDLQNYSKNLEGNSLKLSNIFKGKIGDKANEAYRSGRMHEYGILKNLQDALGNDINQGIESSESKSLKDAFKTAQKNYAEKFAPFEDPNIVKFTRQGGDPDLILPHFLRTGQSDRSSMLQKLLGNLPDHNKSYPLYKYLSKAADENGNINPLKLKTLYQKLGKNQKELLVSDKNLRNQLDNYVDLVNKNAAPLQSMFNPQTGQRLSDFARVAPIIQALSGYSTHGVPGAIAGVGVPAVATRGMNYLLTNPAFREYFVKSLMKSKPWEINKAIVPPAQGIAQGVFEGNT